MIERLEHLLLATAPIDGVSIGRRGDPTTVRIDFRPEATPEQRTAAQAVVDAFDWSNAAQAAWEEDQHPERKTLRQAAQQAVDDIDTYLAAAETGTANQIQQRDHAALKRLAQMMRQVIRRLIQID